MRGRLLCVGSCERAKVARFGKWNEERFCREGNFRRFEGECWYRGASKARKFGEIFEWVTEQINCWLRRILLPSTSKVNDLRYLMCGGIDRRNYLIRHSNKKKKRISSKREYFYTIFFKRSELPSTLVSVLNEFSDQWTENTWNENERACWANILVSSGSSNGFE